MLSFFPRGVLDEILNLIESVSAGFPSYFCQLFILSRLFGPASLLCLHWQPQGLRLAHLLSFLSPRTTKLWRGSRVCPVRMYVRTFVCSPFVIALATSFIIQFRYNFTQVLGMTIPRISLRFNVIGSRSSSQ